MYKTHEYFEELNNIYMEVLGREIDNDGYITYKSLIVQKKTTLDKIRNNLKHSSEYKSKHSNNSKHSNFIKYNDKLTNIIMPFEQKTEHSPTIKKSSFLTEISTKTFAKVEKTKNIKPQIQFVNNKDQEIPNINPFLDTNIINVFICCRNNELDFYKFKDGMIDIETKNPKYSFVYFILENDSTDNTPKLVLDFMESRNGNYSIVRGLKKQKWGSVKTLNRVQDMAQYRNAMKNICNEWTNSNYSLIIDTGISFSDETFTKMIDLIEKTPHIAMVTPFGVVGNSVTYYDTFALETLNNVRGKLPEFNKDNLGYVKSAFAGFVLIRTYVLKFCRWEATDYLCSEHNFFNKQVREYGDIVILKTANVVWEK